MTLHVTVVGTEGRHLVVRIRELDVSIYVKKYRGEARQLDAIDRAVREFIYTTLEVELVTDAYR